MRWIAMLLIFVCAVIATPLHAEDDDEAKPKVLAEDMLSGFHCLQARDFSGVLQALAQHSQEYQGHRQEWHQENDAVGQHELAGVRAIDP